MASLGHNELTDPVLTKICNTLIITLICCNELTSQFEKDEIIPVNGSVMSLKMQNVLNEKKRKKMCLTSSIGTWIFMSVLCYFNLLRAE